MAILLSAVRKERCYRKSYNSRLYHKGRKTKLHRSPFYYYYSNFTAFPIPYQNYWVFRKAGFPAWAAHVALLADFHGKRVHLTEIHNSGTYWAQHC